MNVKDKIWDCMFLLFCFFVYLIWSYSMPVSFCPDEEMRLYLPQFIYEYGRLPDGYETIHASDWGFSYAFYPCFLGPMVSALFMKIMSFFSTEPRGLLMAARLTSVLCGVGTVYFTMKIARRRFSKKVRWIFVALTGTLPQFVFLSGYVNNDIIAVMGVSMILYAWMLGLEKWTYKNGLLLAVGIAVCALSYYNAYGWILLSMLILAVSYAKKLGENSGLLNFTKIAAFTGALVVMCIAYFFIRNAILYQGDFLGMKTLTASSERFAIDALKPSLRDSPKNLKLSFLEMLTTRQYTGFSWIEFSYISFIGMFGHMSVPMDLIYYFLYSVIFLSGMLGWTALKLSKGGCAQPRAHRCYDAFLIIGMIVTVALSLYYSYTVDYQPQGRYLMGSVTALLFLCAEGWQRTLSGIEKRFGEVCFTVISTAICTFAIVNIVNVYTHYIAPLA